jgi:hypothetical protein
MKRSKWVFSEPVGKLPRQPPIPRPATIAAVAVLTADQIQFRTTRLKGLLDTALPLSVWNNYHYELKPGEKRRPVARQGVSCWYDAEQVEAAGTGLPRPPMIVQGGSMGGVKKHRR